MMKADVLDKFDTIRACTKYKVDGVEMDYLPYDIDNVKIEAIYEDIPGWKQDLTKLTSFNDAPQALKDYVAYLERHLEVPITTVSVGPDRVQTLASK
jgi:adenylosuccinate synthase